MNLSLAILAREPEYIELCIESARHIADEIIVVLDSRAPKNTIDILTRIQNEEENMKILTRAWDWGSNQKQFLLEKEKESTRDGSQVFISKYAIC